jgi:hypothetical protein
MRQIIMPEKISKIGLENALKTLKLKLIEDKNNKKLFFASNLAEKKIYERQSENFC